MPSPLILGPLVVLLCASACLGSGEADTLPGVSVTTRRPVNTIDPISGRPVDDTITYSVNLQGPATITEHGPVFLAATTVVIAFSEAANRDRLIALDLPAQELHARAALQNRVVAYGKILDDGSPDPAPPAAPPAARPDPAQAERR